MQFTCSIYNYMSKMIQIRNVPNHIHRVFKGRAARADMTLSDYLLVELRQLAERPTLEEIFDRIGHRSRVRLSESPADAVRAERDSL